MLGACWKVFPPRKRPSQTFEHVKVRISRSSSRNRVDIDYRFAGSEEITLKATQPDRVLVDHCNEVCSGVTLNYSDIFVVLIISLGQVRRH